MEHGVYVMGSVSHLIIAPPLTVSRAELDQGLAAVDSALKVTDALTIRAPTGHSRTATTT
jgi:4-aminobutyrate aminotransferase-like enzyme